MGYKIIIIFCTLGGKLKLTESTDILIVCGLSTHEHTYVIYIYPNNDDSTKKSGTFPLLEI